MAEKAIGEVVVDMTTRKAYMEAQRVPLSSVNAEFGGGDGEGPMEPSASWKDYVDAKDEAMEARIASQLDKLPTKGTTWAAMGTAVGILLAVAAFAGDRFNGGMSASALVESNRAEQIETDTAQDAKLNLMDQKLDILIRQTAENGSSSRSPVTEQIQ